MKDPIVRIVLFPRPTAIWGDAPVTTEPFHVKDFSQAVVVVGQGPGMGSTPATVSVAIEQSADGVKWFAIGSPVGPGANAEGTGTFDFEVEWFRATATVSGTVKGLTMWAVAALVPRVQAA